MREQEAQPMDTTPRRATVAAAAQSFINHLDSLPIREAVQVFEVQRLALLEFCMQQIRGQVDGDEFNTIQDDLLNKTANVDKNLQTRFSILQQQERQSTQTKISLQRLKKSNQEKIHSKQRCQ